MASVLRARRHELGLAGEAFLYGALLPNDHDYDVVAHALNERFVELGGNHPVAYSDSEAVTDGGLGS